MKEMAGWPTNGNGNGFLLGWRFESSVLIDQPKSLCVLAKC